MTSRLQQHLWASRLRWAGLCFALALLGCGPRNLTVEDVGAAFDAEGKVTVDGEPLSAGIIRLIPANENWEPLGEPPEEGRIEEGKFKFKASHGRKRVEITADEAGLDIPPRYNEDSQLKVYISHATENTLTFELESS